MPGPQAGDEITRVGAGRRPDAAGVRHIDPAAARAALAFVDPPPPEADIQPLTEMLLAHFAAFDAVERLDLDGIEPSATFAALWDG